VNRPAFFSGGPQGRIELVPEPTKGRVYFMTAAAKKLLTEFALLDPKEQALVKNQMLSHPQDRQLAALNRLRGATAGSDLVTKLLKERSRD
jgi:hypothetical protein